jgi:hypothetical protein
MNKCRYFNGVQNQQCKAGVSYKSLIGRLPCIADPGGDIAECELCDRYTDSEMQQIKERQRESVSFVVKALESISKLKGSQGSVDCPKCNKTIHWTRASYNGHIHAQCETAGCVSFLQ